MKKISNIIAGTFKIIAHCSKAVLNAYREQKSAELKLTIITHN